MGFKFGRLDMISGGTGRCDNSLEWCGRDGSGEKRLGHLNFFFGGSGLMRGGKGVRRTLRLVT